LQLAIKQLSTGLRVEPCSSAVLQFSVEEIGQLVPLLPNPCTPISSTRWQTEDLDGNRILFQVGRGVQRGDNGREGETQTVECGLLTEEFVELV